MDGELQRLVYWRARFRCEYCLLPNEYSGSPFEVDHVIAAKHGGLTVADNLALSCFYCNSYKGPNIAGIDPRSGRVVRLYNPRRDRWNAHFQLNGATISDRTAIGRTTVAVLRMNDPDLVALRTMLIDRGVYPKDGRKRRQ